MAIGDADTTNATTAEIQSTIDVSSPRYIHPSDSPRLVLVPVPFDGLGYRSWRRDSMEYVNTSVELWSELEDRYDQTNRAKLYQIQKEINDLSQGVLDITGYYTKMKKLWEELTNLSAKSVCNYQCTCGAKENMHKIEQDRRLIQFLMDLNEVYTVVRGSILMMNPLPSMAQAFALLVQEEKQREFRPRNRLNFETSAMNTSITAPRSFRTNFSVNNRPRPYCDFCKKQGHTKEKNNRGRNITANVVAGAHAMPSDTMSNQGEDLENQGGNNNQNVNLSKEQYDQVVRLLQHFHSDGTGDSSNINPANATVNFAGNFAGIVTCTSSIDFDKLS
ncbi:PREDICTED: uncharacterized protein LOC109227881 [Nicotiana attenuata]|uniref:uncharacterized protein LOC109227881 n=1 Tax=Nicotiana attenuata TaxID=49451 RepID=UPI0009045D2B|nr:PREDICTED: uncharacterized protein LOC109227881 [Nicotiana attenuata]